MSPDGKRSISRNGVVARVTRILESFTRSTPRLPLNEIAEAARLPASTTRRLLVQLEESGLVYQSPESALYSPTTKLAHIGSLALDALSLEEVARPGLKRLSSRSGEAAFLGRLEKRNVIYMAHETEAREVTISIQAGDARDALTTAIGSVIIAEVPDLYNEESKLKIFTETEYTMSLKERFNTTIAQVKQKGYVLGRGGRAAESISLAVPVKLRDKEIPAAIAISGPAYRFSKESALALLPDLITEAEQITQIYA